MDGVSIISYSIVLSYDSTMGFHRRDMLQFFVDLNNRVIDRFSPEERKNIGIHTCPGGDCDSVHSFDVPYENLLPSMFKMVSAIREALCCYYSQPVPERRILPNTMRVGNRQGKGLQAHRREHSKECKWRQAGNKP
jgi:hypothetical protein